MTTRESMSVSRNYFPGHVALRIFEMFLQTNMKGLAAQSGIKGKVADSNSSQISRGGRTVGLHLYWSAAIVKRAQLKREPTFSQAVSYEKKEQENQLSADSQSINQLINTHFSEPHTKIQVYSQLSQIIFSALNTIFISFVIFKKNCSFYCIFQKEIINSCHHSLL